MPLSRRALRLPGYALAAATPVTYAWYTHTSGDYLLEGAWRGIYFWSRVGPIVARYKWVDLTTRGGGAERAAAFEELHDLYAPVALSVILALRGFYIKFGQFASARADIVPAQYLEQFQTLQDRVPPKELDHVKGTIERALQRPVEDVFERFDAEPLGAASIGQAHYARLRDGAEVVVKVQYPEVRRTFYLDMSCIRAVVGMVEPSLSPVLDELKKQFLTEFDFRGEAQNLIDVAQCLLPSWGGSVAMPAPVMDLCGEHVLTMTYLPGDKLETELKREWKRLGMEVKDMQLKLQGRAPPGPRSLAVGLCLLRWYSRLLDLVEDLRDAGARALAILGLLQPAGGSPRPRRARLPDRERVLRTLLGVHAEQVLVHGVFNADLHPGNFLLLPDGRVGLIDFGQVKRIDAVTRRKLARLLVALARGDEADTIDAFTDLGVRSERMDPRFLQANAKLLFARVDDELTGGRPLLDFLFDLRTWDKLTAVPGELYLPARAATMLRGLALLLHCNVSIAEEWRGVAEKVLAEGQ